MSANSRLPTSKSRNLRNGWVFLFMAGTGTASAAPTAFGGQWSCQAPPNNSRSCIETDCQVRSGRSFTIDWKTKKVNISGFSGKVKIIQTRNDEKQVHGLLRNFVSFNYTYVRANWKDGKAEAFYYIGSDTSPGAWDFGFANCTVTE